MGTLAKSQDTLPNYFRKDNLVQMLFKIKVFFLVQHTVNIL